MSARDSARTRTTCSPRSSRRRRFERVGAVTASLNTELTELSLETLRLRKSAKWRFFDPDVLPAFVAEMDFPLAPAVKIALAEAVELDDTGYGYPDALGLADAFAEFAAARLDWEVDPARVSAAPDVVNGLTSRLRAVAKPGDRVIINTPVYTPFFGIIAELGLELVEVPLVEGALDVDGIDAEFRRGAVALILCSPHNPTGTLPTAGQLGALAASAAQHDAWVLSDEIHWPLTLPGAHHIPFLSVSEEAREHGIALVS